MTENVIENAGEPPVPAPQPASPAAVPPPAATRGQASKQMQSKGRKRNWRGLIFLIMLLLTVIGIAGYVASQILVQGVFKQPNLPNDSSQQRRQSVQIGAPEVPDEGGLGGNGKDELSEYAKKQKERAEAAAAAGDRPADPGTPSGAPMAGASTAGYPGGQAGTGAGGAGGQNASKSRFDSPLNSDGSGAASGGSAMGAGGLNPVSAIGAVQQGLQAANPQGANALGSQLQPTATPKAQASMIGNRNYVIAKGTSIDCVLNTAINSTVPGMTSCTLTRNVYSDNGKVVLLERGSVATGEFKADIKVGQSRIFVLWSRVKTPNGVVINLDSPGADALGRSGFGGDIDNHWWERIGSAFMLSMVQDAIGYAATRGANNNNGATQMYFNNTQQTGNQMASKVLEGTINIPPTLTKNQGERVSIFVARDLDFSSVYGLTTQ